jgi:hypothetical protein
VLRDNQGEILIQIVAQYWPQALQEEAVASLEAIAGYLNVYEPRNGDR